LIAIGTKTTITTPLRNGAQVMTVNAAECQSYTVVVSSNSTDRFIGPVSSSPQVCRYEKKIMIFDPKCHIPEVITNPKSIRTDMGELHLEVNCPPAGFKTFQIDTDFFENLTISVVAGLLSSIFFCTFF
jgi:hypothetical protein